MKIDLDGPILDIKGKPFANGDERLDMQAVARIAMDKGQSAEDRLARIIAYLNTRGGDLALGDVCCVALQAQLPDEQNLSGAEKVKRFKLAVAIANGGVQDLKAEDISLLKTMIGKCYGTAIVGRAYELLDPVADAPAE